MNVTILDFPPISGQYPEFSFGERFNSPLWVEFKSQSGDIWYGCFPKMWDKGFNTALIDNNGHSAFIVAGGQGFLIDIVNKKRIVTTEDYQAIESAIKTMNPEYYMAGLFDSAYVIDTKGEIKRLNRISRLTEYFSPDKKTTKLLVC